MAVLALAGAGSLLGSTVGLGSVGWIVGDVIGNMLFGPKQQGTVSEGPRLGDLTVQSSAYGGAIPYGYGTVRMAGNIIWSPGIVETKNTTTQSQSGGKGGGSAKSTSITYTYTCSFATAFGAGEADAVLRIWADSKLIYDIGSDTTETTIMEGLNFRFYPGSETQLPDGLIEADKGIGNVPANRGLIYIVFDNVPLENFANRIPNITAEIVYKNPAAQHPNLLWTPIDHPIVHRNTSSSGVAIDYKRNVVYTNIDSADKTTSAIRRMQYGTMVEDRVVLVSDMGITDTGFDVNRLYCGLDGYIYILGAGGNSRNILRLDPNSFQQVAQFGDLTTGGPGSIDTHNTPTHFAFTGFFGTVVAYGLNQRVYFLVCANVFNGVGVLDAQTMAYVWGDGIFLDEVDNIGVVNGDIFDGSGTAYICGGGITGSGDPNIGIYKIVVQAIAAYDALSGSSNGVDFEKLVTIAAGDLVPGATAITGGVAIGRDPSDGGILIGATASGTKVLFKYVEEQGILWTVIVPDYKNEIVTGIPTNTRLSGTTYSWVGGTGSTIRTVDLRDGTYTVDDSWPGDLGVSWPQIYDARSNSIVYRGPSDGFGTHLWGKLILGRASANGDSLAAIVSDLCAKIGFTEDDIDVSELDDIVPGYVVGQPSTIRAALDPLTQGFFFDGVESDFIMKFVKRGGDPVATLFQSDLAPMDQDTGTVIKETRTQEVELPVRINILYMDGDNDYQQGTQSDKRVSAPIPSMLSKNVISIQLPMVLDVETAKQIAQKWLFTSWMERVAYECLTSWKWMLLDPADVVEIVLRDGSTFLCRIIKNQVGADLSINLNLLAQDAASYTSTVQASGGDGPNPQTIPSPSYTRLFLLDIPLLLDTNDTMGSASRVYYAMGGYGQPGWPGASLFKSSDNVSFVQAGQSLNEVSYGSVASLLPPPPISPFCPDLTSELVVFMVTGADHLESVTTLEVYNGANAALLLAADGTPEIIQYRDVTPNVDGSFTLSWLLRGRRGTDVFTDNHVVGETFILLERNTMESILLSLGELDVQRYYKGVGFNTMLIDADLETRTNTGRDLMPWAPAQVAAENDTTGNIIISWLRRTRINGAWRDGTPTVPLSEETEAYEIDIMGESSGDVVRTLVATTDSVTYTDADIITDFGTHPNYLTVRVYQMSAAVGRGFTRQVTVPVL